MPHPFPPRRSSDLATWMGGGMFVTENGAPKLLPSGLPEVRICFVPREKVVFRGNWDVMGLSGTGSYDYELPDQFIPHDFTMERSEEHTSELQSLMRISYAVFCLKKKNK